MRPDSTIWIRTTRPPLEWVSITQQMTRIYGALSASERATATSTIVSSDYGVTGALQIYGNPKVLPPSYSPQLSDYYWLPQHVAATDDPDGRLQPVGRQLHVHVGNHSLRI